VAVAPVLDVVEWQQLREAYADYDQQRELVIKDCRDVQKAAKQAIFAAQRGNLENAAALIQQAVDGARTIFERHVEPLPGLRYGSFSNALEELAEAQLFLAWLEAEAKSQVAVLPSRSSLAGGLLSAFEYLGALSDFSGEVGRKAVEAATRRDTAAVRRCLMAVYSSHRLLASIPLSENQRKKLEAAQRNLRKLESIEYDLAVRGGAPKGSGPDMQEDSEAE